MNKLILSALIALATTASLAQAADVADDGDGAASKDAIRCTSGTCFNNVKDRPATMRSPDSAAAVARDLTTTGGGTPILEESKSTK